jgi:hypothetical protein
MCGHVRLCRASRVLSGLSGAVWGPGGEAHILVPAAAVLCAGTVGALWEGKGVSITLTTSCMCGPDLAAAGVRHEQQF